MRANVEQRMIRDQTMILSAEVGGRPCFWQDSNAPAHFRSLPTSARYIVQLTPMQGSPPGATYTYVDPINHGRNQPLMFRPR